MPWCDRCDVYLAPNTLRPDGTCPTCEQEVDSADMKASVSERAPWHFWLMVVAVVAYLGWRLVQGVAWVAQHI
jgi:hypothetical protein